MHKTTFTGKTNRKLQDSWQKEFSWLLYNASDNKMMCKKKCHLIYHFCGKIQAKTFAWPCWVRFDQTFEF
jgi:formate-dependent nitrite reductase cytochrome c552 subunit